MVWVKLDDHFPEHPKVVRAGPMAGWLYICGLAYCARNLTDGFIPEAVIGRLANVKHPNLLTERLIDAGLWERRPNGIQIHDYLDFQPSKNDIEKKRNSTATRVATWRNSKVKQIDGNAVTPAYPSSGSNAVSNTTPVPDPTRPDPPQESTPPVGRHPKKPKRVTVVDEAFRANMRAKYASIFGNTVDERIDECLAYPTTQQWSDKQIAVQRWLRKDAERMPARATNGHRPTHAAVEDGDKYRREAIELGFDPDR